MVYFTCRGDLVSRVSEYIYGSRAATSLNRNSYAWTIDETTRTSFVA